MKVKGRRQSKNVIDLRPVSMGEARRSKSQIDMAFNDGKETKGQTKKVNTAVNSIRGKGYNIENLGSKAMKSAAPKSAKNIDKLKPVFKAKKAK